MTSISKDEEQILNRRFPKIIADEYSVAINIATRLLGDDVQKYLTQYNEWRMKFIAANGLTISGLTVGVNSHNIDNKKNVALPNMYDPPINNDAQFAIDKLATALDRMEAFRADPSLYLAKSVVRKAIEIAGDETLKELVGDKFLEELDNRARSKNSVKAGLAKAKKDPKQAEKAIVKGCWDVWQTKPDQYRNNTNFASAMIEKFRPDNPDEESKHLSSVKVIADWCKDWKAQK